MMTPLKESEVDCFMKKFLSLVLSLALALSLCAVASAERTLTLVAPAGAPALSVATLAAEKPDSYTFVAADTIAAAFAANEADFVIAPVNAGAKLFKAGKSTYRLAAVISWGNLYIAAQKPELKAEDLNGQKITLFGEDTINASVVLYALKENGIEPAEVAYLAGAADTQSLLLSDAEAIVVTAEPALTAASMKNDQIGAVAVNDLLKQATGDDGYVQAGLFVKAETLEQDADAVKACLDLIAGSAARCTEDPEAVAEAAVTLEILPNAKVALKAIPGCAIRFVPAAEARERVEKTAAIDLKQFGGELPADDFYYAEAK